jgi:hypothetical protein
MVVSPIGNCARHVQPHIADEHPELFVLHGPLARTDDVAHEVRAAFRSRAEQRRPRHQEQYPEQDQTHREADSPEADPQQAGDKPRTTQ